MKLKRILYALVLVLLCSCTATKYQIANTSWHSSISVVNDGVNGDVITGLYFESDSVINIFKSVISDSTLIVRPYKYATGTYSVNYEKKPIIHITAMTLQNEDIMYSGRFESKKTIFLMKQDSIKKYFGKTSMNIDN